VLCNQEVLWDDGRPPASPSFFSLLLLFLYYYYRLVKMEKELKELWGRWWNVSSLCKTPTNCWLWRRHSSTSSSSSPYDVVICRPLTHTFLFSIEKQTFS
jgi:hypothetical protein